MSSNSSVPASDLPPGFPGGLGTIIDVIWTTTYLDVAAAALVTYDTFLTLEQEVRLVWRGRWGLPALLYLVTRYGVTIQACLNLVSVLDYNLDDDACNAWNVFSNWSIPVIMVLVEATLALRVVALWENMKVVMVTVWLCWAVASAAMLTMMGLALQGSFGVPSPDPPILGCQIGGPMNNYWSIYVPSLFFEVVVASLTLWSALRHKRILKTSPLLHVLIRDGFVYFFIVLALMLIALFGTLFAPLLYSSWFPQISITIASIVAVRLFLNLRQVATERGYLSKNSMELGTLPTIKTAPTTTNGSIAFTVDESILASGDQGSPTLPLQ